LNKYKNKTLQKWERRTSKINRSSQQLKRKKKVRIHFHSLNCILEKIEKTETVVAPVETPADGGEIPTVEVDEQKLVNIKIMDLNKR
jgi:hypothetical protein